MKLLNKPSFWSFCSKHEIILKNYKVWSFNSFQLYSRLKLLFISNKKFSPLDICVLSKAIFISNFFISIFLYL